jgi:hypothetical protein
MSPSLQIRRTRGVLKSLRQYSSVFQAVRLTIREPIFIWSLIVDRIITYANVIVSKTKGITQKAIIQSTGPVTPPERNGTPGICSGFTVKLIE